MAIYYPSYLYIFTCAFSRHLNGAVLETLSRPSLLITDSFNALNVQARRRERDTQLMSKFFKLYNHFQFLSKTSYVEFFTMCVFTFS